MFFEIGVPKNFSKLTGKYVSGSVVNHPGEPCFFETRLRHSFFLVNFVKLSKTTFLQNTSGGCFCIYGTTIYDICLIKKHNFS